MLCSEPEKKSSIEGPNLGFYDRVFVRYDRVCESIHGFLHFGYVLPLPCERNLQDGFGQRAGIRVVDFAAVQSKRAQIHITIGVLGA